MMSEFKRSPSKVWWANDNSDWRIASSMSPGSQDSGFSDSETSPNSNNNRNNKSNITTPVRTENVSKIPKDIFKDVSNQPNTKNLNDNFKEKCTPKKHVQPELFGKKENKTEEEKHHQSDRLIFSEPSKKNRYAKYSPRVSRSLFARKNISFESDCYSSDVTTDHVQHSYDITGSITEASNSDASFENSFESIKSLPNVLLTIKKKKNDDQLVGKLNYSAPAILETVNADEGITSFNGNSLVSSDCESELECLFNDKGFDSPKHTSTPKIAISDQPMRHKKLPLNLYMKYQNQRVPPIHIEDESDDRAVKMWLSQTKQMYEPECMTSLQCKSIFSNLEKKVNQVVASLFSDINEIISFAKFIEAEYQNLNRDPTSSESICQNIARNIADFVKTYKKSSYPKILKYLSEIQSPDKQTSIKLTSQMFHSWQTIKQEIFNESIKNLVAKLEDPASEIQLRALVIGITSTALRNGEFIEMFVKYDAIPVFLIMCEKSEASTVRSLILRCLSTLCCMTSSVKQLGKYSGIQLIADILEEKTRPEPEKSEAVTLLAQVTAPWIEDNNSVRGLQDYSNKLVKSLTAFISSTKCCQNLLLCAAALVNLSTMDPQSIHYMLRHKSVQILLDIVNKRGSQTSIYQLEQVAALIANVSAVEQARSMLTDIGVSVTLVQFLQKNSLNEEVQKRLQQKSIIALSRLCRDKKSAQDIVNSGGVDKLVKLCREKEARYNNDAVLVAALATLRKISECCGNQVIHPQDSQELVEPKLLDSFLAYSTQNESYV